MKCYAEQYNLQSAGGTSGESSICVATPADSFIGDDMKQIDISTPKHPNMYAIVDDEDYERISKYHWYVVKNGNYYYAYGNGKGPEREHLFMHRKVLNLLQYDKTCVDHINRNGLDNRKRNLRICSFQQNMLNSKPMHNRTSKYKGVKRNKKNNNWRVNISYKGNKYEIGSFVDEEMAARAYDKKAKQLFGEFAYLNFKDTNNV